MDNKLITAIIVAAGFSKRLKGKLPKQLITISHKPVLAYTLDQFEKSRLINNIVLIVPQKFIRQCQNLIKKYKYKKVAQVVIGGQTRQQSVFRGLKAAGPCRYVLIHDGVRPLLNQKIIARVIAAVRKFAAVSCAVAASDTIVEAKAGLISRPLEREKLWRIQTPQAFSFDLIFAAHQKAKQRGICTVTDDAQLMLRLNKKVRLVKGSSQNIKITTISDLDLFRKLRS